MWNNVGGERLHDNYCCADAKLRRESEKYGLTLVLTVG